MFAKIAMACIAGSACFLATPARAERGECELDANQASGTYGFTAQGLATGATPFAPAGPFTQAGTVTQLVTQETASTFRGTWSLSLAQNDASGYTPNVRFGGVFEVNRATCGGNFFVTMPMQIAAPAFRVVIVAQGDELRTISALPNLLISYVSAKKL